MNLLPSIAMDITKSPPTHGVLAEARRMLPLRRKQLLAAASIIVCCLVAVGVPMAWHGVIDWNVWTLSVAAGAIVVKVVCDGSLIGASILFPLTFACAVFTLIGDFATSCCFLGCIFVLVTALLLTNLIDDRIQGLRDIAPGNCSSVLKWCQESPEVAAY